MGRYGRWSLEDLVALQPDAVDGMLRKDKRALANRLRKLRKPMIIDEPVQPLDERACAACGNAMGLHPKPAYYPCPIGVIAGMAVTLS